jgi:hypothetical protein
MRRTRTTVIATAFLLTGCYHATIETGRPPSAVTVEDQWADAWVYGLVPPDTINAAQRCTSGVARVETQLSFLNQLVGALTLGIYTPMSIRVTCAQGSATGPSVPNGEDLAATFAAAAVLSREIGAPVLVTLR